MLLRSYTYEVSLPECNPSAETVNAIAELSDDIREVLPYINARVKGGVYNHEAGTLRFLWEGKAITLFPRRIAIAKLSGREEAEQVLEWLKDFINATWENRHQIEPSYRKGNEVKLLDVYKLLSGTNCKECGEPTCMAFAVKLIGQQADVRDCRPLFGDDCNEKRQRLLALLESAGYFIP